MTIFVVYRCYWDYDSGSHTNLGYCLDEEAAKTAVTGWELRKLRSEEVVKEAREWQTAWDMKNPRPTFGTLPFRAKLPHEGIPKKKMSAQQLEDRRKAGLAHQAALQEEGRPYREWSERRYAEFHAWFDVTFTEQEREDTSGGISAIKDEFEYERLEELV